MIVCGMYVCIYRELQVREREKSREYVQAGKMGVCDVMKMRFVTRDESARTLISHPSDEIPRDVTSCNLVERHQRFGGTCFLVLKLGEASSSETFLLIYRSTQSDIL